MLIVAGGAFLAAANIGTGGKVAIAAAVGWWVAASALIAGTALRRWPDLRGPVGATLAVGAVASVVTAFALTRDREVDEQIATGAPPAAARDDGSGPAAASGGASEVEGAERETSAPLRQDGERRRETASKSESESKPKSDSKPESESKPKRNVQVRAGRFSGVSGHEGTGKAAVVKRAEGGRVLTFNDFDVDMGAGDVRVYLTRGEPASDGDVRDFKDLAPLKGNVGDQQYELPKGIDLRRYSTVVIWCIPFTTRIAQAPLS